MTGRVINLRQARKAKSRDEKRKAGTQNAASFGRTKAERKIEAAKSDKASRDLDAHRRDR